MRKLTVLLGVLAGLWLAVELIAPQIAESAFEERVRARTRDAVGIEADVDSFPMVTRLALTGEVRHLTVRVDEVVRRRLSFAELVYELEGIELDRQALLRREADLESIERGAVRAVLAPSGLANLFAAANQLGDLTVEVRDGQLVLLRGGRVVFDVALPTDLFPCRPSGTTRDDQIVLGCTFTEIPEAFLRAAGGS